MKTIFMAVPYGTDARNLLRTDVFRILRDSGTRVVILSPAAADDYFIREFTGDDVVVEELLTRRLPLLQRVFNLIRLRWLVNPEFSDSTRIKHRVARRENLFVRFRLALLYPLARSRKVREFLRRVDLFFFREGWYREIFNKYRPSLVLVAFPFMPPVFPVLKQAIRNNVPTVNFVSSWDNLSTRWELPVRADKIIVWNEINQLEAVGMHGYAPGDVCISGVPQFDAYFSGEELSSREEFFREIGADINRKLLVYTAGGPHISRADPEIIEILERYIRENQFLFPCQLLVRPHPGTRYETYDKFRDSPNIIVEHPGRFSSSYLDKWDPTRRDLIHLRNMMLHADVVMNIASTITIEACICDTPVINIGFDGYQRKPYLESLVRYFDYTHYRNIVRAGGVRIAASREELLAQVNMYLENPELDSQGRKRIVREQCFYTDGKSGERVANCILDWLGREK